MGNIFAIVAFVLLWLGLGLFFYVVFRTLVHRSRQGDDGRWEHGL